MSGSIGKQSTILQQLHDMMHVLVRGQCGALSPSSKAHCRACEQVLRRWDYGVMSDVTSVLYLQAPADMKGGNFRVWDPNVYDWSLRNATVQPAPTQSIVIKARLSNLRPCPAP